MEVIRIPDVEALSLEGEPALSIGSSYQTDIFYQYRNLIPERLCVICFDKHLPGIRLIDKSVFDLKDERDKEKADFIKLSYGQKVSFYGLNLYYFGKYLFVFAKNGDMRIASRRRRIHVS